MARAGDEFDAEPFDVVIGIVERVDFQFAAVAGAGIDMAYAQRAAEDAQDFLLSRCASMRSASSAAAALRF